jgi:signal transduction histidine kinase
VSINASDRPLAVLQIEDDAADALLVREMLADINRPITLTTVQRLSEGLRLLGEQYWDVVLLDLGLPDSQGIGGLTMLRTQAPDVPVVVLTGLNDESVGIGAVEHGAQDYLIKGQVDERILGRAISYAIARQQTDAALTRQAEELARANAALVRSNQDLDEFAYTVSHDLKEPLRGLHTYATILLEDYGKILDADGQAKLATLIRLTQRMDTLIDALLELSRVGRAELAMQETALGPVVDEVVDSLALLLLEAHAEVHMPTPLPSVRCDKVRVRQLFHNLITNALKYNDKAQKWVEIGVIEARLTEQRAQPGVPSSQARSAPVFYVRDNGIGIPERHQTAIFGIFRRLHGRDKFGGGTGVGLTIVKKIIDRHGGRIWVESTPGEGTTFWFTLG